MATDEHDFMVGPRRVQPRLNRLISETGGIQLEPRVMQVLVYLARRPGQVVLREELLGEVWSDAIVTDEALTRAVFDLRKILGDSAQKPAIIETIRKVGYRWIAPVEPPPASTRRLETPLVPTLGIGLAALSVGLAFAIWAARQDPVRETPKIVDQLTSFKGYETHPALSPSGDRLAFAWDGAQRDNFDIYLKSIDAENPLRLTHDPAIDDNPAFSPDGRSLAFVRRSADTCGLYLVDVPGRDVRRVAECREAGVSPPTWSSDGGALIFADRPSPDEPYRLLRLDLASRQVSPLSQPPEGLLGDIYPAVSPDGHHLAFVRATAKSTITTYLSPALGDIHVLTWAAGSVAVDPAATAPRQLTLDNEETPGLAWTPDSQRLIFASTRGGLGYALWQVSLSGGPPVPLIDGEGLLRHPVIASRGSGLAYEQWTGETDIRRVPTVNTSVDGTSVDDTPVEPRPGTRLVSSTRSDFNPAYSPDGSRLAFTSRRTGSPEIWVSQADGSRPTRLTSTAGGRATTPRWSPDGRRIAFEIQQDGRGGIWTIGADGGTPRRVTRDLTDDRTPSWSRDGRRIYFASSRGGSWQVWRIPVDGGKAEQVTRHGGFAAFESESGTIYYSKRDLGGIWQVEGAREKRVAALAPEQWGNWTLVSNHLYYVELLEDRTTRLIALDLGDGSRQTVALIADWISRETPNLSVSPDGRSVAFAQYEGLASDLRFVKGFD